MKYLKKLNVVATKPLKIKNTAINQFIFLQTSIGNYSIYSDIKELVVTNTIPLTEEKKIDKLTVLSIAPLFAETIKRINEQRPLGELYEM